MFHKHGLSILSYGDMRFTFLPKYKIIINFYLSNHTFNLLSIDVFLKISHALINFPNLFIKYYIKCINVFFKNIVMLSILQSFECKVFLLL